MSKLLRSRKFLTLLVDVVVSLAVYFVGKYAAPSLAEDILFLIGAMQPVFLAMIAGIAAEDVAALRAGAHPNQRGVG